MTRKKVPAYVVTPTDQRSRAMQPGVEKKIQPEVASYKRQASSSKQRLTAGIGCYRISILTNTGERHGKR